MIAQMCLPVADEIFLVEAGASIADGPSRGDVWMLMWLGAVEIAPQWLDWVRDPGRHQPLFRRNARDDLHPFLNAVVTVTTGSVTS